MSTQRRARAQLSCASCRAGKLKCNRAHPCDQCVKRTKGSECCYAPAPKRKPRRSASTKERIAQLEELVVKLMNQEPGRSNGHEHTSNSSAESEQQMTPDSNQETGESLGDDDGTESNASDTGQVRMANGVSSYSGGAHWEAILSRIEELKTSEDAEESTQEQERIESNKAHSRLLLMGQPTVTREYLLQSIPSAQVAERLLFVYFNSSNPLLPCIHRPTFLIEYDRFLIDDSTASIAWIALFYGILAIGCQISLFQITPGDQHTAILKDASRYQMLSSEALVLADVASPQKHVIEAMMMFCGAEHMRGNAADGLRIWLTIGVVLRLCMKMGYHRDPSLIKGLTPFETEMRRRVWYTTYIFDVLTSFSLGLPDMIRQIQSDCRPPRNIVDTDFGPNSKELPQSRPFTDLTPIAYCIVKSRLAKLFAQAADVSHSLAHPESAAVWKIDQDLDEAYNAVPDSLRFVNMRLCLLDPPPVIFNRFKLHLLYHKTRCVLYRRYLASRSCKPEEEVFRVKCADAAIEILRHWEILHAASQPGGQLESFPFFLDSFSIADFLLAAMIVCLELDRLRKSHETPNSTTLERMEEIKGLLETSYKIYAKPAHGRNPQVPSRVLRALEKILNKARAEPLPAQAPKSEAALVLESPLQALPYVTPQNGSEFVGGPYLRQSSDPSPYAAVPDLDWQEPFGDTYMSNGFINWQQWDAALRNSTTEQSAAPHSWDTMDMSIGLTGGLDGFQSFGDSMTGNALAASQMGFPTSGGIADGFNGY